MSKVSIIIPIYNVEQWIERCAHSLFGQTMEDLEYIFIDDCTPDDSVAILLRVLESYPHRKHQVKLLHNEKNHGLAFTRACGIQAASGDYIIYSDSDDWVELDYCEKLYQKAVEEHADVVACSHFESFDGENEHAVVTKYHTDVPRQVIREIYKHSIPTFGWMHLVKRSLFVDNKILPFEGINSGEDLNVIFRILFFAKRLAHVETPLYHYVRRAGSISLSTDYGFMWDNYISKNVEGLERFVQEQGVAEEFGTTINYLKFIKKLYLLQGPAPQLRRWWNTWPECNNDIAKFSAIPTRTRKIYGLCSKSYVLLWLYFKVVRKIVG